MHSSCLVTERKEEQRERGYENEEQGEKRREYK